MWKVMLAPQVLRLCECMNAEIARSKGHNRHPTAMSVEFVWMRLVVAKIYIDIFLIFNPTLFNIMTSWTITAR